LNRDCATETASMGPNQNSAHPDCPKRISRAGKRQKRTKKSCHAFPAVVDSIFTARRESEKRMCWFYYS
jgi:hypothetical protein